MEVDFLLIHIALHVKISDNLFSIIVYCVLGTFELGDEKEEEVYEVINISKIKAHTPNLRIVNLYGIRCIDTFL